MSQSRRMELKFRQQLLTVILLAGACGVIDAGKEVSSLFKFPREFLFGVSTASYQIEGGWSEDGKKYTYSNCQRLSGQGNFDLIS